MEKKYKKIDLGKEVKIEIEDVLSYYGWTNKLLVKMVDTSEELYNMFLDKMVEMVNTKFDEFTPVVCPSYKEIKIWCTNLMNNKNPLNIFLNIEKMRKLLSKWVKLKKQILLNSKDYDAIEELEDTEEIIKECIEDKIYDLTFVRSRFKLNGLEREFDDDDKRPDGEEEEDNKLQNAEKMWDDDTSNFNIAKRFDKTKIFNNILNKVKRKYNLEEI